MHGPVLGCDKNRVGVGWAVTKCNQLKPTATNPCVKLQPSGLYIEMLIFSPLLFL